MLKLPGSLVDSRYLVLGCRIFGHYGVALICCLFPEIGEHRFMLAGLLAFVVAPLAIMIDLYFDVDKLGWVDPIFDVVTIILLINLVPHLWIVGLLLCVVAAEAPSISVAKRSYRYYALGFTLVVLGMSGVAMVHQVENWILPIAVLLAAYPAVTTFAYFQMKTHDALRDQAKAHESLMLIAGGVAHDFNNLLTSIQGFSDIAMGQLEAEHPARNSVKEIAEAGSRAGLLTRQLLSFSGRQVAVRQKLDLKEEISAIAGLLATSIDPNIRIEVSAERALPLVDADKGQLQQVFLNVLLNAAEAIKPPGKITVHLERRSAQVVIEISDTGSGILPEYLEKVFEPFFTSKAHGHGLGLAAVKRILEEHNGHISISSEPGAGTDVMITLPAVTEEYPLEKAGSEHAIGGHPLVLVVDDELAVRKVARQALESMGFEVVEAADGTECLDWYQKFGNQLDAIVLDVKMPGPDGWECLARVRQQNKTLPVLVISGFDPEGRNVPDDARVGFLPKPFRLTDLETSLTRLMAGNGGTTDPLPCA